MLDFFGMLKMKEKKRTMKWEKKTLAKYYHPVSSMELL